LTLLYHQWSGNGPWRTPTLYDPVAVTYTLRPDLCPTQPMRLSVDDQGFTRPEPGAPNSNVCLHSDSQAFLRLLTDRITADPRR
jgi:purine nucleosidase